VPEIKIRIGAAVDQSMRTVFKPLVQSAIDARKQIQKEFASISVGMRTGFTAGARTARAAFSDTTKAGDDMSRELANQAKRRTRMAEQESRREYATTIRLANEAGRERIRILNANNRLELQSAKQLERDRLRTAERSQSAVGKFADRTSHRATRFLMPNMPIASMARRGASEVLQGVGVDLDASNSIRRNVDLSKRVTGLQNQASINDQNISSDSLHGSIAGAADKYGYSRMEGAEALGKFADKTGDMGLGQQALSKMAERAAAGGGSLEDMMDAAGDVAMNLGPVKDKLGALVGVLDAMTVQGAKGAVEMKDLARTSMARIAANAGRFEGDAGLNMKKLGALAQLARQSGGASSAAEAGTAVARLTDQFSLPARRKQFKALGVDVDSKTDKGQFADVFETIKKTIVAADGNQDKLKLPFASSVASKAVMPLNKAYNQAGGGQKGLEAMDALLKSFMATEDIQEKLNAANVRRNEETAVKVQKFQNKLDDVTKGALAKLLPALEKLEEPALKLAGHLGDLASWVASNPGDALIEAVALVIARAGIESAFRHGIESVIKDLAGAGGGGASAAKSLGGMQITGGLVGAITSTAVIGAFAFAIEQAGEAAIAHFFKKDAERQNADAVQTGNDGAALANATVRARKGEYTPEDKEALERAIAHTKQVVERETTNVAVAADPMGAGFGQEDSSSLADSKEVTAMRADIAKMSALLADMLSGKLRVHVTNMPPPEQPKAPVAGGG
jgi:hypothetical protein